MARHPETFPDFWSRSWLIFSMDDKENGILLVLDNVIPHDCSYSNLSNIALPKI